MTSNIHDDYNLDEDYEENEILEEGKNMQNDDDDTPEQFDIDIIRFKDSISSKRN